MKIVFDNVQSNVFVFFNGILVIFVDFAMGLRDNALWRIRVIFVNTRRVVNENLGLKN